MPRKKDTKDEEKKETKSEAKEAFKFLMERYKEQNPVKYEQKRSALEKRLAEL